MSSPNINLLIIVGGQLLYVSCILFGTEAVTASHVHDVIKVTDINSKICQVRVDTPIIKVCSPCLLKAKVLTIFISQTNW